jgi:ATP-binding cassette subfamily B protein
MISIGLVVPFLVAISEPKLLLKNQIIKRATDNLDIISDDQILIFVSIIFILSILLSGFIKYLALYASVKISFGIGMQVCQKIYGNTLYQPYSFYIKNSTSKLINSVTINADRLLTIINSAVIIIGSILTVIGVATILVIINPLISITSFIFIGFLYLVIATFVRKNLERNSVIINSKGQKIIGLLQEGYGGIRDVILYHAQNFYCKRYLDHEERRKTALSQNLILGNTPRIFFDMFGMLIIA